MAFLRFGHVAVRYTTKVRRTHHQGYFKREGEKKMNGDHPPKKRGK
jgi:hypothetical protein